jgi:hypothetical protein
MAEAEKNVLDDSSLLVTLTVGQLKALVRGEIQADNVNGNQNEGQLLSAKEAGKRWGVPSTWIQTAARQGKLPYVELGHYKRFAPKDLDKFIQEHKK